MYQTPEILKKFPALKRLSLNGGRKRIRLVRQLSENDGGAAALSMVLGYHGKHVRLEEVSKEIGVGQTAATVETILRAARAYKLRGRAVRIEIDDLPALSQGAILHWEFRQFVVFDRLSRGVVHVVDPGWGPRRIPIESFRRSFTGMALLFEPTEGFVQQAAQPRRISDLLGLVLERRQLLAKILTSSLLVQLLSLALPLLTGILIDRAIPRSDYPFLLLLAVGFCVLQLFNTLAGFIRAHLMIRLRAQLEVSFTMRFMDHLIELPYSFFQHRTSGDLMVRLNSNNTLREILTTTVFSAFMDGTMASVYLVLLLLANSRMAILVIVIAVARLGLMGLMRWKQRQFLRQGMENQARSQTVQVEMLTGMETLKSMGLERQVADYWSNVFVDGLNVSIKRGRLDAAFNVATSLLGILSSLVTMFYGAYLVLNGTWTLGTMMAFSAIVGGFMGPLNNLVSSILQLQSAEIFLERINDVMDAPPEQNAAAVVAAGPLTGAIALENVSFRYSAQDRMVVQNVSMQIEPGRHVALVGRTGSGKSSLARLMAGIYDPAAGRVLFDGRDMKTLDRRSVRHQLGIVTQDIELFRGSIRRNIGLSSPDMDLSAIVRAAKLACIHDEIIAMPMGYETVLSDRGLSLSGGQRQRLAIARALAANPKILILDEATSHLDAVTEEKLNRNLASLRCTRIIIAHRLSTVRDADLILVLDGGSVVEQGVHEKLVAGGGAYAELVGAQREIAKPAPQHS